MIANSAVQSSMRTLFSMVFCSQTPQQCLIHVQQSLFSIRLLLTISQDTFYQTTCVKSLNYWSKRKTSAVPNPRSELCSHVISCH